MAFNVVTATKSNEENTPTGTRSSYDPGSEGASVPKDSLGSELVYSKTFNAPTTSCSGSQRVTFADLPARNASSDKAHNWDSTRSP